jgi:hypothetical protein
MQYHSPCIVVLPVKVSVDTDIPEQRSQPEIPFGNLKGHSICRTGRYSFSGLGTACTGLAFAPLDTPLQTGTHL